VSIIDNVTLWLRNQLTNYRQMWSVLNGFERVLAVLWSVSFVMSTAYAMITGRSPDWANAGTLLVLGILLAPVIGSAILARADLSAARECVISAMETEPSGAPRIAEVTCIHGAPMRIIYGDHGWQLAGPAVPERDPEPSTT
jgi:hypothetical protein